MLVFVFTTKDERDTFAYIYKKYKCLMLKKAWEILHNPVLAEDAVSEAFIRIYKNMDKIDDPDSGRCAAFILTIVRNAALTMYRRETGNVVSWDDVAEPTDSFDLETYVTSAVSAEKIRSVLDRMNEELRSVFVLKYAYDLSHKNIGSLIGITENNVTVRLHRAKKKLAELLKKEGYVHE